MAGLGMGGIAERERIQAGDRARAHGEDIAQDAADAGRGALIGLDVARMVVALHLEDAGEAVADVDHAGVLAGALDDAGARGRQAAQMHLGGFVGAVLVPHRREDAELGEARRAADQIEDAGVLVGLEAMFGDELGGDFRLIENRLVGNSFRLEIAMHRSSTCKPMDRSAIAPDFQRKK